MSLIVKTIDKEIETYFVGIPIDGVSVGKYEIPLEHFCIMAGHFLSGGVFGWGDGTPDCVNKSLTALFNFYKRTEDGKWVRKSLEKLAKGK